MGFTKLHIVTFSVLFAEFKFPLHYLFTQKLFKSISEQKLSTIPKPYPHHIAHVETAWFLQKILCCYADKQRGSTFYGRFFHLFSFCCVSPNRKHRNNSKLMVLTLSLSNESIFFTYCITILSRNCRCPI